MPSSDESRREYLTLRAVDPETGRDCEVQISFDRMHAVARRGMGHAKECGYLVPETLQHPTSIFEGLRVDADEDERGFGWRCYCTTPDRAFRPDGSERSAYPGQVFLVFVNDEGVAYNWRWEVADADDPHLPADHTTRFKKRVL